LDLPVSAYKKALLLFNALTEDPYSVVKECRAIRGNFISIDEATLKAKCPDIDDRVISELLTKPEMR
jgi:hypothetical protein